jgi:hypothetical protein
MFFIEIASCGGRTHAVILLADLKPAALDHSAKDASLILASKILILAN